MPNKNNIPESIKLLIADYFKGAISEEGLLTLKIWLSESDENFHLFNSLKSAWLFSGKEQYATSLQTKEALSKVKLRISKHKSQTMHPFWNISRIAASWVLFFILGSIISVYISKKIFRDTVNNQSTTISAPLGARSLIDLPDGTKVWLNAGSKITYNNHYGNSSREVQLIGEAYFDVKTNKKIPFLVNTHDLVVKALGTRFNVKAYPNERTVTATLEEGKIEVTPLLRKKAIAQTITLKPNEMVSYNRVESRFESNPNSDVNKTSDTKVTTTATVIPNVKTKLITSWKDEIWSIEAQPLGSLAPVLERRYNIEIEFTSEEIRKFKFTGKIQKETIEQIMTALELSAPISYKIEKNRIILSINHKKIQQYNQNTN